MTAHFRRFLGITLLCSVILAVAGGILFSYFLTPYYHPYLAITFGLTTIIHLVLFYSSTRKKITDRQLVNWVIRSFAIKFFCYLTIAIIFFLVEKTKSQRIAFVISLFILYLTYSWLEIASLLKFLKSEANK